LLNGILSSLAAGGCSSSSLPERNRSTARCSWARCWQPSAARDADQALLPRGGVGRRLTAIFVAYQTGFYMAAPPGAWSPADVPYSDLSTRASVGVCAVRRLSPGRLEIPLPVFAIPFLQAGRSMALALVLAGFIWDLAAAIRSNRSTFAGSRSGSAASRSD
jgi:hypothetical protein